MTLCTDVASERHAAAADGSHVALVEEFTAQHLPALEAALTTSVSGLGQGLEWIESASGQAVGIRGRGGRRWRPLLTLAAAEVCGGRAEAAMDAAVAIELTHTASLVLDDLPCMDDTALRRGQMATHRVVGSAGAILVAVGLLGRAAELLGTSRAGGILAAEWGLTIGLEGMSGGQAVDVAHAGSGAARAAARRLHRRKTTALSAFALLAGAQSVGARPAVAGALARFGRDLGWAYQLADDAEDLSEDHSAGRAPGGRSPRRQSDFILARAQRQLTRAAVVPPGGTRLLTALAEAVVRGSQQGRVLAR